MQGDEVEMRAPDLARDQPTHEGEYLQPWTKHLGRGCCGDGRKLRSESVLAEEGAEKKWPASARGSCYEMFILRKQSAGAQIASSWL